MRKEVDRLCRAINYQFTDKAHLELALSHRSIGRLNNERIEFLGDSIVNFVVAEALYRQFPTAKEGELSRLRAGLVNGEMLAVIANEFALGDYLYLGLGELKSGGFARPSILAGALEALIGAIFMDSDFNTCKQCVLAWYTSRLETLDLKQQFIDPKTRLQEYVQGKGLTLPKYKVTQTLGKAHNQEFVVECCVEGVGVPVEGRGRSRRKAEQNAAENILEKIVNDTD
jgi:ribonuclease III